jgi:tetratricopeptide (TPR) repeat protein
VEREFTQEEAERLNGLTEKAWELIKGDLLQGGAGSRQAGWLARRRLQSAKHLFEEALQLNPSGWSSMWALGKIHQRLGDHREALEWFGKAHSVNPAQPDVAREAGVAALELGETALALEFCATALGQRPDDGGLMANLALAHLIAGDLGEAERRAKDAVDQDWRDRVSQNVLRLIQEVALGQRPAPKSLRDLASQR